MINVYILTFCRNIKLFYGTALIFKTLRAGFPNAKITVVDNASIPEARTRIELLAKKNECLFEQIHRPGIQPHIFYQNTIRVMAEDQNSNGPLVFLDPDICLWHSCEDFAFDGLMAGKVFGKFNDYITQTITMPRLHTSFLWIPNARKLYNEVWKIKAKRFDFEPFLSFSCCVDGAWYRYDTGASIYAAISAKTSRFTEEHFNRYDHIYGGSHIDWIYPSYDPKCQQMLSRIHGYAREGNLQALKGIWRYQDEVFNRSFMSKTKGERRAENGYQNN